MTYIAAPKRDILLKKHNIYPNVSNINHSKYPVWQCGCRLQPTEHPVFSPFPSLVPSSFYRQKWLIL